MAALALLAILFLIPLTAMWRGYVLSVLWSWFVVPAFGVAEISVPIAIGLAVVVGFFTPLHGDSDKSFEDQIAIAVGGSFVAPLMALGFGWLVHLFV